MLQMDCFHIAAIVRKEMLPTGLLKYEFCTLNEFSFRYCDNCVDWLCTQCKNAHARVRLTKDHTVTQKNTEEAKQIRKMMSNERLLCQVSYPRVFCTLQNYNYQYV